MAIPARIQERIIAGLKKFQPVLQAARTRDVNESDTVVIITDMLTEIFGYDKYSEITTEYSVRKSFCDLAIKIDGKAELLIEAKAINLDLKEDHVNQTVSYGASSGAEWVILTNGVIWQIYKIHFSKPVDKDLVAEINLIELNPRKDDELEMLYFLCKEGLGKSLLEEVYTQRRALSKYFIGQLVLTDSIVDVIKRELKRVHPGVRTENEDIRHVLLTDVLKRDVIDGDKATEAKKQIAKAANVALRTVSARKTGQESNQNHEPEDDPALLP